MQPTVHENNHSRSRSSSTTTLTLLQLTRVSSAVSRSPPTSTSHNSNTTMDTRNRMNFVFAVWCLLEIVTVAAAAPMAADRSSEYINMAPLEFPTESNNSTIFKRNETLLKWLLHNELAPVIRVPLILNGDSNGNNKANSGDGGGEAADLVRDQPPAPHIFEEDILNFNRDKAMAATTEVIVRDFNGGTRGQLDNSDVEELQSNDNLNENHLADDEQLEERFNSKSPIHRLDAEPLMLDTVDNRIVIDHDVESKMFYILLAGTLILITIGLYAGLIVWRGRLEKRYGMRERLVTQDDYFNNNDMRNNGI